MLSYTVTGKNQAFKRESRRDRSSAGIGRAEGVAGNGAAHSPAIPPEGEADGSLSLSLRLLKATDDTTCVLKSGVKWTRGQCIEAINRNVRQFIEYHGVTHVAMWTLTTADIPTVKVFYRRWHSLQRRALKIICPSGDYIAILEFQKRGAPHLHILIAVTEDIKSSIKWHMSKGQLHPTVSSMCPHLLWLFDQLREIQPAYGFGSWVSIQPIRSIKEAVSDYVSKYLWKGDPNTPEDVGRVRRVRYGNKRNWGCMDNQRFNWLYGRSWAWRKGVAKFAEVEGRKYAYRKNYGNGETETFVTSMTPAKLKMILGERWQYHYREDIIKCFYMSVICDIEQVMPEHAFNELWKAGKLNEFLQKINEQYVLMGPDRFFDTPPAYVHRAELDIAVVDPMYNKPLCLNLPGPNRSEPATAGREPGPGLAAPAIREPGPPESQTSATVRPGMVETFMVTVDGEDF